MFKLLTDSSANLPQEIVSSRQIGVIPLIVSVDGREMLCYDVQAPVDTDAFYDMMRNNPDVKIQTSMINEHTFTEAFEQYLVRGEDVLYVGMSSGISGTYHAAQRAAQELRVKYPERAVETVDTLAASLGEGIMVIAAADMRDNGADAAAAAAELNEARLRMKQLFMVDDLLYLKKGGRISGAAALLGSIINLRPILKGDDEGRIVLEGKALGRKKALRQLAEAIGKYDIVSPYKGLAGIAHGGCAADAAEFADVMREKYGIENIITVCYEPGTGAHVGPGTIAVFFWGMENTRERKPPLAMLGEKIAEERSVIKSDIEQRLRKDREARKE